MRPIDADALVERYGEPCHSFLDVIEDMPTIDAVPVVHARWIHCKGKSNLWYCSNCGDKMIYNPTRRTYNIVKLSMAEKNKFCRNCGARMDGEPDDDSC